VSALTRPLARWRARTRRLGEQWGTWRGEWAAERELEHALSGSGPILVGPWLSEVGYEVLYWVPFLRWVAAAYRIPESRFVVMSRGGTAAWYSGVCGRYLEVFDHIAPDALAARAAAGDLKQRAVSDLDRQLVDIAARTLGTRPNLLHPSLLFRWFAPFWSGVESMSFVERHTRYAAVQPPQLPLPRSLPPDYVAVKFYSARSLADTPENRAHVRAVIAALGARFTVVQLDTGLHVDDHADYGAGSSADGRVISVNQALEPGSILAVQTRIIAGARMFVGTCGSLAWLAPLLGVDTVPVFTDASFLHAHLHLARRVYGRVPGAGRFSPVDLAGLHAAGLTVGDGTTASGASRS
jgi:hypothetical protein